MGIDPYKDRASNPATFDRRGYMAVASDTTDFATVPKAVMCITPGNVRFLPVDNADSEPLTLNALTFGMILPFFVRRILATGTTATFMAIEG